MREKNAAAIAAIMLSAVGTMSPAISATVIQLNAGPTITDQQIAQSGLPPRPNSQLSAEAYQDWLRMVEEPSLRVIPHVEHAGPGLAAWNRPFATRRGQSNRDARWSGTALNNSETSGYALGGGNEPFANFGTKTEAIIVVPTVRSAGKCDGTTQYVRMLVGLDGFYQSQDVLVGGVQASATCSNGKTTVSYIGYYDWSPGGSFTIKNFVINPGDVVCMQVWASSSKKGHLYLKNFTQGTDTTINIAAPKGHSFAGDSAEWLTTAATTTSGKSLPMPKFYEISSSNNFVTVNGGSSYSPSNPGANTSYEYTMVDSKNRPIAYTFTSTDDSLTYYEASKNQTIRLVGVSLLTAYGAPR